MKPTARPSIQHPPLAGRSTPAPAPRNYPSIEDLPLPGEQDQDFLPLLAHPLPAGRPEVLGRPRW